MLNTVITIIADAINTLDVIFSNVDDNDNEFVNTEEDHE